MKRLTSTLLTTCAVSIVCAEVAAQAAILPRLDRGDSLTISAIGTSFTGYYWDPVNQVSEPSTWFSRTGAWLDALYPGKVTLYNEGIGGAASKYTPTYSAVNGQSGLDYQLDRALAHNPDVVFIEFAANDAYVPYGISKQMSKDNLQTMIDRINGYAAGRHKQVDIIIQTMANFAGQHAAARPEIADYYQGYRDVAAANGLLLVDNYVNWVKLYDSEADHATWNSYMNCGVHPNDLGAERVIVPEVQRALLNQAPEPTGMVLLVTGLLGVVAYVWRSRR